MIYTAKHPDFIIFIAGFQARARQAEIQLSEFRSPPVRPNKLHSLQGNTLPESPKSAGKKAVRPGNYREPNIPTCRGLCRISSAAADFAA